MKNKELQHPIIVLFSLVSLSSFLGKMLISYLPPFPVISDSLTYIEIANGIREGVYLSIDGVYYSPGYPFFLSQIFSYFGSDPSTVYQVQFAVLGIVAFMAFQIARTYLKIPFYLSLMTALIVILWPYMILYSLLIMSAVPYTVVSLMAIFITMKALSENKLRWFALSGIAFGIAALMRPVALLLPFWLFGTGVLSTWFFNYRLPPIKNLITSLLFFIIIVAPWFTFKTIQMYKVESTTAQSSHVFDKAFITLAYEIDRDPEASVYASDVVISKFKNIFRFWNPGAGGYQAELLTESKPEAKYLISIYKFGFFTLLALAFISILIIPNYMLVVLWSCILYVWMLHTVLFPYPRYTLPIIPLMLISAGFAVANWRTIIENIKKMKLPAKPS
ncbi:glycosyltransferase family 39 protein [Candidatus Nomurabacteria bacterium]|nr:glycosyltransferase family 39 protein [Candidatus Nomurabacteria bacterium]